MTTYVKHYDDPVRARAARRHRDWLAALDGAVHVPSVHTSSDHHLELDHLGHRRPGPDDLETLAAALGTLHAAAHTKHLYAADLDTPFITTDDLVISDFPSPRQALLNRMPIPITGLPAAIYKDANIRNFLLTDNGVAIIDFDDLTLAPFGYDLAKLIVSTAMTHGRLDPRTVEHALAVYNSQTAVAGDNACPLRRFRLYTEFHHLSTARYLHRNGYLFAWPSVRPW